MTPVEFKYIKQLIEKNRSLKKVARIANRSYSIVGYIDKARNFQHYVQIRPGGKKNKKQENLYSIAKPTPVKKQTPKDYSGALLAEMKRLRLSIDSLNKSTSMQLPLLSKPSNDGPAIDETPEDETSEDEYIDIPTWKLGCFLIGIVFLFIAFLFFINSGVNPFLD